MEFYERLFDQSAVDKICAFAGVKPKQADFGGRSNASYAGDMPAAQRRAAIQAYERVYREIDDRFGGDVPESWKQDLALIGG